MTSSKANATLRQAFDYYGGLFDVLLGVLIDTLTGVFDDAENELAKLLINYQNAC